MGINRPTVNGGTISVSDSAALAAMSINGLPIGSSVWNEDVGAFFTLTSSARTAITIASTDGYDSGVWTFANATFTGFEDCTLLISLIGADDVFGGAYNIDVVDSATEVEVTPAPDGATTAPILGSATLFSDKLVTDSVVAASGVIGLRWVVATALEAPVPNADLATMTAHTFKARKTNSTGVPEDASATEATALLDVATTSLKGLMSAADKTKLDGIATKVETTLGSDNNTISCDVTALGDGLYVVELEGVTDSASSIVYLTVNGAHPATPRTCNLLGAEGIAFAITVPNTSTVKIVDTSQQALAADNNVSGLLHVTSRNGQKSAIEGASNALSGTQNYTQFIKGYFVPGAVLTSIGVLASGVGVFRAGSTLRVTRMGD